MSQAWPWVVPLGLQFRASLLAGVDNTWADALSRSSTSSAEWTLCPSVFEELVVQFGRPDIDLFASRSNHRLPIFLSRSERTQAGGPDAFTVEWNQWSSISLFPLTATALMLEVVRRLESYRGQVLLVTPRWEAQPWFAALIDWCPAPVPAGPSAAGGVGDPPHGLASLTRLEFL